MSISALPVCLQLPQPGLSLLCTHFPIFDFIHLGHVQWEPKHLQLCQPQLQVSLTFPHWRTTPRQTPNYLKHMSKKYLKVLSALLNSRGEAVARNVSVLRWIKLSQIDGKDESRRAAWGAPPLTMQVWHCYLHISKRVPFSNSRVTTQLQIACFFLAYKVS